MSAHEGYLSGLRYPRRDLRTHRGGASDRFNVTRGTGLTSITETKMNSMRWLARPRGSKIPLRIASRKLGCPIVQLAMIAITDPPATKVPRFQPKDCPARYQRRQACCRMRRNQSGCRSTAPFQECERCRDEGIMFAFLFFRPSNRTLSMQRRRARLG